MANIKGKKGGSSSPRTPVESPDSLHSIATAKILLALGEGEFAGGITAKDIFLDSTPIESADSTVNYPGVTWDFRTGNQMQDYIPGMPAVENEITINTALKAIQPWTRAISNTQLSAVRVRIGVPALQEQKDNGDVAGYRVEYKIELSTDGSGYSTVLNGAFDGKTTSLYERSHRIELPKANTGWQIRVSRSTPDSTSNRIASATNIEAYSEIIDAKLRYPNTALLFVTFDAKQFNNIPQISVKARGRVIRIPTTYDPSSRTYSGAWDGSFKWAYSNNPAWVFYDLLLNERFGLGDRISASQVDKWELYRIAQYCDQPVPDGRGGNGTEPRFLCDVYIQSQNEAFTVLRDLASIFRGMTYWSNNQVVAIADMPAANDERNYIYTRANVVGGKFTYSSGSERDRYSTAMVSFSDPANHYADDIEPVFDSELVRRYGVRQLSITAIGCKRRTEANRRGRWALLTNAKDRLITFNAGLDGFIPQPGRIIYVADQNLSGRIIGGRVSSVSGRVITLDRIPDAVPGDRLLVNLPSGKSEARTIQAVNGKLVTVSVVWSMTPEPEAVWSIDVKDVAIQQYRVTSVKDNGDNTFTISGVFHNPDKYAAIDTGARLDERPISAIPPGVQAPPIEVSINSYSRVVQGISVETMRVSWTAPDNAIAYECQWRKDNGDWVSMPRTSSLGFEVDGIYSGRYLARVSAINASDIGSVWSTSVEVQLTGKTGNPPKPIGFKSTPINWGVRLNWGFPTNTSDTLKTEIQYSPNSDQSNPLLLADVPYPQSEYTQLGLRAGQEFWYRARLVDKTGNQSEWTDWIRGVSNANADDYLKDISDGFLTSKDGERLTSDINTNLEASMQNALAYHGTVEHQYQQYGEVRADILVVKTTVAEVDKALAEMSTTVQAQIKDVTATLEDKMTSVIDADGATAIHTLKAGVRINGVMYDAGMSIAVLAQAGQPMVTRIGFNANQFVLMSGSGNTQYSPFSVVNGQVFMNSALIQDASINRGKITDVLNSDNYIQGKTGVSINFKTGMAEFNDVTIRGTVYATDGDFKGTVRAEKIIGDVTTAGIIPFSSNTAKGRVKVESHAVYKGGMPYDMYLSIPNIQVRMDGYDESGSTPSSVNLAANVKVIIGGNTVLNNTINVTHARLSFFSGGVLIKSNSENINIDVSVEIPVVGGSYPVTLTLFDSPIFAFKANSSQFI